MNGTLPVAVSIGAQVLAKVATEGTIEERFKKILEPQNMMNGCFMCGSDDEEFRAAVGGLMLSYPTDSPEQKAIGREMRAINRLSLILQSAQQGLSVAPVGDDDEDDDFKPVGLLALFRERTKR